MTGPAVAEGAPVAAPDGLALDPLAALGELDGAPGDAGAQALQDAAPFGEPEPDPIAPPFAAPKGRRRRKVSGIGDDAVPLDLRELYTPETVGRAFTGLLDATYRLAGAAPLDAAERQNVAEAFAYYVQKRAPADLGKYQPELVLGLAILATVPPRMDRVVEVTVPWWRKLFRRFSGKSDARARDFDRAREDES